MLPGQMLPGQMSLWQLASEKDDPRNLQGVPQNITHLFFFTISHLPENLG